MNRPSLVRQFYNYDDHVSSYLPLTVSSIPQTRFYSQLIVGIA